MRIAKYISNAGYCSRRDAEKLILNKKVYLNNKLCITPSTLVEKDVKDFFGKKVYKTIIPRNVRISEAPSHGKPVLIYDTSCVGSKAYIELAKEVIFNQ